MIQTYKNIRISFRSRKPMSDVVTKIARKYKGTGGGHALACGANVPIINLNEFLREITINFLKIK